MIQKRFGIKTDETMAFGDYLNDLEMLQQAGYSFAMANAHPDIRRAAVSRRLAMKRTAF
jgi:hydroxymethylpyrimidine pyrophosphatase-like HAD family hydrolase